MESKSRSDVSKLHEIIASLTRAKKSKNAYVENLKNYKEKIIDCYKKFKVEKRLLFHQISIPRDNYFCQNKIILQKLLNHNRLIFILLRQNRKFENLHENMSIFK